jgi:hypothetical protein
LPNAQEVRSTDSGPVNEPTLHHSGSNSHFKMFEMCQAFAQLQGRSEPKSPGHSVETTSPFRLQPLKRCCVVRNGKSGLSAAGDKTATNPFYLYVLKQFTGNQRRTRGLLTTTRALSVHAGSGRELFWQDDSLACARTFQWCIRYWCATSLAAADQGRRT